MKIDGATGVSPVQPRSSQGVPSRGAAKECSPRPQAVGKEYGRRIEPQRGERVVLIWPLGGAALSSAAIRRGAIEMDVFGTYGEPACFSKRQPRVGKTFRNRNSWPSATVRFQQNSSPMPKGLRAQNLKAATLWRPRTSRVWRTSRKDLSHPSFSISPEWRREDGECWLGSENRKVRSS